jgi:ubiquinone/menaquinone biosynthesis C-methylase UbiE
MASDPAEQDTDAAGATVARAGRYADANPARWHGRVIVRSADVALAAMPMPLSVLDVGCGTGALLREVLVRVPYGESYVGVDPTADRVAEAREYSDPRIRFLRAEPESLPFPDAHFDLVVSSLSFDHWADQHRGVAELARVVSKSGTVVLIDRAAGWLPAKGRARSPRRMTDLLTAAGLRVRKREIVFRIAYTVPLVRAFIATH